MTRIDLGTFKVTADKLIVSDPCYARASTGQYIVVNAAPGVWAATTGVCADDVQRVNHWVEARLASWTRAPKWVPRRTVPVDSGQIGFFDEARYPPPWN